MRLAVALLAIAASLQAQSTLLAPTGTLRASFIATNPVQGRVDAKTGVTTGPATDLIRELARRLAVPFAVTPLPDAGAVLESVKSGKVDVGFLAVEAERATQVISPMRTRALELRTLYGRTPRFRSRTTSIGRA